VGPDSTLFVSARAAGQSVSTLKGTRRRA